MIASTTPATVWTRLAAPDRHAPKEPVAPPLCSFGPCRPASTTRAHPATEAAEAIILAH
jgi:hypothetical protein